MKESRKEFIRQAYNSACSEWKEKIEKEFPKLFKKTELEIGKWYRDSMNIVFVTKIVDKTVWGYGFYTDGTWHNEYDMYNIDCMKLETVTDQEVEQALIKEATKRGFKDGVQYKGVGDFTGLKKVKSFEGMTFYGRGQKLTDGMGGAIFCNGKWAKIIETITKAEAEEKLGLKIVD